MRLLASVALVTVASLTACNNKPAPAKAERTTAPAATPAPAAPSAKPQATTNTDIAAAVRMVLDEYEGIRKGLAADETKGAAEAAKKIAEAASGAEKNASAAQKPKLAALAKAATALTDEKDDLASVRNAFGELSKALVDLLSSDEALRKGLHVFKCPMTKTYQKWVQPSDKLENPYMGKKMPGCGSASDWKV